MQNDCKLYNNSLFTQQAVAISPSVFLQRIGKRQYLLQVWLCFQEGKKQRCTPSIFSRNRPTVNTDMKIDWQPKGMYDISSAVIT